MRKALNENPMVQIAILAVGVIAFGLILMMSMGGGGSDVAPDDPGAVVPESATSESSAPADVPGASAATATPSTPTPDAAPSGSAGTATSPSTSTPTEPPAGAGSSSSADGMLPSKGLPQDVLVAFAKDDAIALLVTHPKSLSGRQMKSAVRQLESRNDVATFLVDSDKIARYSRITSGVSVSRVPALVVIRPRKLTDNVPTASVSYGFRDKDGIEQAIDDALYKGGQRGIYP